MSNASLAGCSILICEDEPLIALGIADALSRAGARVLKARSIAMRSLLSKTRFHRPSSWITRLPTARVRSSANA